MPDYCGVLVRECPVPQHFDDAFACGDFQRSRQHPQGSLRQAIACAAGFCSRHALGRAQEHPGRTHRQHGNDACARSPGIHLEPDSPSAHVRLPFPYRLAHGTSLAWNAPDRYGRHGRHVCRSAKVVRQFYPKNEGVERHRG